MITSKERAQILLTQAELERRRDRARLWRRTKKIGGCRGRFRGEAHRKRPTEPLQSPTFSPGFSQPQSDCTCRRPTITCTPPSASVAVQRNL